MNIELVCVGKIKESFYREGVCEYAKRLSRYCSLKITELVDEKTPDKQSEALDSKIKEIEGERILNALRERSYVIVLDIAGKALDSVQLSKYIESLTVDGISDIQFVIGGSLGVSPKVLNRADYKLSFSKMTFPHQLMRVILLEQIYRSFRIMKNEPYHK